VLSPEDVEYGNDIDILAKKLPEQIQAASYAALQAHMTLTDLERLYDVELFDGQEGRDALHELKEAMRHLRNARRIAEARVALFADEATDGSDEAAEARAARDNYKRDRDQYATDLGRANGSLSALKLIAKHGDMPETTRREMLDALGGDPS
jgi:hypothetical protein